MNAAGVGAGDRVPSGTVQVPEDRECIAYEESVCFEAELQETTNISKRKALQLRPERLCHMYA